MTTETETSWKELLTKAMAIHGETWSDVEAHTLSDEHLARPVSLEYGGDEGDPFTLWTKKRVYFSVSYDGAEGVRSVARNPEKR